ncbi:pyruvate:ferredoxin (flavodoxin) oxidoreductase [Cloacibacillus evryensis]|uniref:pyruvate:ferredoxin (flavodoxin) oxidoreductase n=1 Tax=Cloacibacillus evryensis TaxID=508460 RepID=UPI0026DF48F9|nr:pyruvate:ferredoxin (flavodoxin) oxidoreductase [Cloacibacillus evryensis]
MKEKKLVTMDGNEAAAYIAYAFTEVAAIYPITPSSPMAEKTDAWSAKGKKNIFGQTVSLIEMQSEAGAAAAVHGALETGALAASFTSSQGLMLMIPVLHRLSGQRHPGVLHVAARTVGTHAFSIFGDHSDVMNCRQCGLAMLATGSVQEIMDLAGVAHLAAIKARIPFMHFFDGFRTSHEIDKVEEMSYETLASLLDREALAAFRAASLNPERPMMRSTVQNPDIYFQVREANNGFYDALPAIVEEYMEEISGITGREYHLFNYYGAPDAEEVIVAMGSVSGTVEEAVDYLNARGRKTGFIQVHLFRPFSLKHLFAVLPATVKKIAALDRCKEMGSNGGPLYQDICTAFTGTGRGVTIVGGRYGLSSKDTDPTQIIAVFDNLAKAEPKNDFTIGITDDVTHLSLPLGDAVYPDGARQMSFKFWGLGGDGTVGANKNTIDIINSYTDKYGQAYFEYDAKKSFGVTISHLRFSDGPIRSSYFVKRADFVAAHNQTYIQNYDIVSELKEGGTLLLNCPWEPDELEGKIPADIRRKLARKRAKFYIINATKIAEKHGLGSHVNIPLQSAFFHLVDLIPIDEAKQYMKDAVKKTFFAKGDEVVSRNIAAIDDGGAMLVKVDIPDSWLDAQDAPKPRRAGEPAIVEKLLAPINRQQGDSLPVSAFKGYEDGTVELGLTAFEKRAIATSVPEWDPARCIQCNRCSYVCPHAVIRPYLLTEAEKEAAPEGFLTMPAIGQKDMYFSMQVSRDDCTGCGSCVTVCPSKEKALTMVPIEKSKSLPEQWAYGLTISDKEGRFDPWTVKGSQFRQPLLEFSAACAGCGETPYAKLMTQLFGDRVYWANATGCSQAWGGAMPGIPYTKNKDGKGPAWSNSLFENNAEFSLGMFLSVKQQREAQRLRAEKLLAAGIPAALKTALEEWLAAFDDFNGSAAAAKKLTAQLEAAQLTGEAAAAAREMLANKDQFSKKSFWMYGGDGWAYDIGFGGLDHVLAMGENVNALIVDTEVYSNTGGQSSKSTPIGAVAQFCISGKKVAKKDLGAMLMTYGNIYVAQVAMGADMNQLIKAMREAEEYEGPSVVIAYTPCLAHGIKGGMGSAQEEMKRAVAAGYWTLYRYDPRKEKPLTVDSKAPTMDYEEFLDGEVRYSALKRTFPENAKKYFKEGSEEAAARYARYKHIEENQ